MSTTIGARLAAAYLLPSLLGLAALGWWVDTLARRALEEELGRKVTAVAAAAAASVPAERLGFLRPGDEGTRTWRNVHERLEELRRATGVRRLVLFTAEERALVDAGGGAAIGSALPELARDRLELAQVFAGAALPSQVLFEHEGTTYKAGYAPVRRDGRVVAAVLAEGSAASFAILGEFRAWLVVLGAGAALAIVAVALLFARSIAAPVGRLAAAAARIGAGDLSTPVRREATAELGVLSRGLEEMRAALQARDRHLQTMLAGIAHEVRNPLGGMELHCGLLLDELEGESAERVKLVRREIRHLGRLVGDFLDFARDRPPRLEPADAVALCREVASLCDPGQRAVAIEVRGEAAPIRCDPPQLSRALLNLVQNAVQASPAGGRVEVAVGARDARVEIRVIDRGAGIAEADAARIFEPFFTTKEKGTGLGLAFAKRIAEAHGGMLAHEATPGGGATFRLVLPVAGHAEGRAA